MQLIIYIFNLTINTSCILVCNMTATSFIDHTKNEWLFLVWYGLSRGCGDVHAGWGQILRQKCQMHTIR